MAAEPNPTSARPAYLVWCGVCSRSEGRSAAEVMEHTRTGWPKCCGQVMAYFTAADRPWTADTALGGPALPGAGDTALDKPALPPK
jgi:hypothetical protein